MRPSDLYVLVPMSNPMRYASRAHLMKPFLDRMKGYGVSVIFVEATFGDRPFEVASLAEPNHLRLRCDHAIWIKEAMLNVAASAVPASAKGIAWIDGDIDFVRDDWAIETLQQLQHNPVVQVFSHAVDLGPSGEIMQTHKGFAYLYTEHGQLPHEKRDGYSHMHPGYGWAWRPEAWNAVGGMLAGAICGAGDNHMAHGLIGRAEESVPGGMHPNYRKMVVDWGERAWRAVKGDIGYVPGTVHHFFHGQKRDRRYVDRWKILRDHQYDPQSDIIWDRFGMPQLRADRVPLKRDLEAYFRSRNEDLGVRFYRGG
jgi:hypothetical protein